MSNNITKPEVIKYLRAQSESKRREYDQGVESLMEWIMNCNGHSEAEIKAKTRETADLLLEADLLDAAIEMIEAPK